MNVLQQLTHTNGKFICRQKLSKLQKLNIPLFYVNKQHNAIAPTLE